MQGLLSRSYPGKIYPVNHQANQVFGLPAYGKIQDIGDSVDLAVLTIPETSMEKTLLECARKGVKGVTIITAGFGEAVEGGRSREEALARLARSYGMRLLGPNVSGTFDLHAQFNASASPAEHLTKNDIAAICQGGYAFYDLLASGFYHRMGVGKFVHTGNECDLTVTDFLEYLGDDPDVRAILMYLEVLRDAGRFVRVAAEVSKRKPIIVYKAGKTEGGARAARSHTGALAGTRGVYEGALRQCAVLISPGIEMLLPLAHALTERPSMRGNRVAIVTMGGSWGVALSDALEEHGLLVPELSRELQGAMRSLGMPIRASTRNPVDIGASGLFFETDTMVALGREILSSGEVDAMVLIGMARPGMLGADAPPRLKIFLEVNKEVIRRFHALEKEMHLPVLIGSCYSPWESQVIYDLNQEGIRAYPRLDDIAQILALAHEYWTRPQSVG
jgi:acyl-CoA synthetase (NDP forming)